MMELPLYKHVLRWGKFTRYLVSFFPEMMIQEDPSYDVDGSCTNVFLGMNYTPIQ